MPHLYTLIQLNGLPIEILINIANNERENKEKGSKDESSYCGKRVAVERFKRYSKFVNHYSQITNDR